MLARPNSSRSSRCAAAAALSPRSTLPPKFTNREGDEYLGTEFVLDTRLKGNGNQGHVGKEYGTELSPEEKRDLIEFLKWQDKPREQKK